MSWNQSLYPAFRLKFLFHNFNERRTNKSNCRTRLFDARQCCTIVNDSYLPYTRGGVYVPHALRMPIGVQDFRLNEADEPVK